ncbi:hypothetical protein FisN_17Hu017 [Fistulifera solaris]|jgi:hypothetical protein|uniref:Helicase-associated domain-containing protein n=1 Tax=Fistulifera solaris TaxID=1519565 RepID=A0A1Z5JGH5_FISSO|nr:hypothetical protein FisN_17Hu017 [Fistulifera solaris]|eukprot:GAX13089.1 hypothetical protein FisN_17Hu017 [Fistulifera solaris]
MDLLEDYTSDESSFAAPENEGDVLESRNQTTTPEDRIWMEKYRQLKAVHDVQGDCKVPNDEHHKPLLSWVATQRSIHRAGNLRQDHEELLTELGFKWSTPSAKPDVKAVDRPSTEVQSTDVDAWDVVFKRLVAFKITRGDMNVTADDDKELYKWIGEQRLSQKKRKLSSDREERLNEIGFTWAVKLTPDEVWDEKYQRLVAFKEKNGHLNVKASDDKKWYKWISKQRSLQKKGKLSSDREERLNEIGFAWAVKLTPDEAWDEKYQRLVAFKEKNGHLNVNASDDKKWYTWISKQRSLQKKGKLSSDREEKLYEIGFVWSQESSLPTGSTERESVITWPQESETLEVQNLAVGTRIEKPFEVEKGKFQLFGGAIESYEQFEDDDGRRFWGYLIQYDDGDKEHLVEADVTRFLVKAERKKRAKPTRDDSTPTKLSKKTKCKSTDTETKAATVDSVVVSSVQSKKRVVTDCVESKAMKTRFFTRAKAKTKEDSKVPKRSMQKVTPGKSENDSQVEHMIEVGYVARIDTKSHEDKENDPELWENVTRKPFLRKGGTEVEPQEKSCGEEDQEGERMVDFESTITSAAQSTGRHWAASFPHKSCPIGSLISCWEGPQNRPDEAPAFEICGCSKKRNSTFDHVYKSITGVPAQIQGVGVHLPIPRFDPLPDEISIDSSQYGGSRASFFTQDCGPSFGNYSKP